MKAKNKLITKLLIKICVFCKVLVVSLQKKKKKKKKKKTKKKKKNGIPCHNKYLSKLDIVFAYQEMFYIVQGNYGGYIK